MTNAQLVTHIRYTRWASQRQVEAAAALSSEELTRDMQVSHKSVLGTLAHIYLGDRIWFSRLADASPRMTLLDAGEECALNTLQRDWPALHERWEAWIAGADIARVVHYRDTKGNPYQTPVWEIMLHVVNHGTYHRGQVTAMLRQLGRIPPPTDLIFYYRTLQPQV